MTDQEREAKIRAYWDERDDRAFLLGLLDAERERVQALEDAAVEASSLAYLAKTHIGLGEYDIARDKASAMTTPEIIAKVRAGEITTTQAYNLLTNDLNDYIGNIVSGEQLYVIRYFRGKIEEIFETLVIEAAIEVKLFELVKEDLVRRQVWKGEPKP